MSLSKLKVLGVVCLVPLMGALSVFERHPPSSQCQRHPVVPYAPCHPTQIQHASFSQILCLANTHYFVDISRLIRHLIPIPRLPTYIREGVFNSEVVANIVLTLAVTHLGRNVQLALPITAWNKSCPGF